MTFASSSRTPSKALTDKQLFQIMFAATFPVFLLAATFVRLGRWIGQADRPAGIPRSLFAEARATSSGALTFAFMG